MSGVISRSETGRSDALAEVRVRGGVAARFAAGPGAGTHLATVAERGGYRLARPSTFAPHLEAMLVNTGGGVAGGDRIAVEAKVEPGADVVLTTSSAERIYRSDSAAAELEVRLQLARGARLDWLPQQTIVFAGACFRRRIEVDLETGSRLLMAEIMTFGRPASPETLAPASIIDRWRVRRDGKLVFAEALALDGAFGEVLARPAVAGGARAAALILYVACDASDMVDGIREAIAGASCESGVSAWNDLLCVRALSTNPRDLVATVAHAIEAISGRALPRVWSI